jgi:uncharacterized membrane protein YgdD (TMEM256/DUF423 family)
VLFTRTVDQVICCVQVWVLAVVQQHAHAPWQTVVFYCLTHALSALICSHMHARPSIHIARLTKVSLYKSINCLVALLLAGVGG